MNQIISIPLYGKKSRIRVLCNPEYPQTILSVMSMAMALIPVDNLIIMQFSILKTKRVSRGSYSLVAMVGT